MTNKYCPRCDMGRLKTWDELNDQEREVVKRLEDSGGYSFPERRATHRWCTRCWYEAKENSQSA